MKYLVRVDDYPRGSTLPNPDVDTTRYPAFHAVFEELGIPYCLGVVPALLTGDRIEYLKTLKNVTIAQHGWDHSAGFENRVLQDIKDDILDGRTILNEIQSPFVYIPPFNELGSVDLFDIVRECGFKVMTGGVESEKVMPDTLTIRKMWGITYIPSHPYLYGHANKMQHTFQKIKGCNVVGITFHWPWEINNLGYIRKILQLIKDKVIRWDHIPLSYISPEQYIMKISSRIPFTEIIKAIQPGDKVFDMGSSNSSLPALMAQAGCDVTAFDLSPEYLWEGLAHAERLGVDYKIESGDFFDIDFPEAFDVVTGCYSFGVNPKYLGQDFTRNNLDVVGEFKKAHDILKPGGKLLLATNHTNKDSLFISYDRGDPLVVFTVHDISWMLGSVGFKINKIKLFKFDENKNLTTFIDSHNANAMYVEAEKI